MSEQEIPSQPTKAELFAENPDRFQDKAEALVIVVRHPETGSLGVILNPEGPRMGSENPMTMKEVFEELLMLRSYVDRKISQSISLLEQEIQKRALERVNSNGKKDFRNFLKRN